MDASVQTDHVDPQVLLNELIKQHNEQQQETEQGKRHNHNSGEETSSELMTHYHQQQDPDAIYRLSDGADTPKSEQELNLQRQHSHPSKIKQKQHHAKISFARNSKKCPSETKSNASESNNCSKGKQLSDQSSLSDRICQVVWSRKESAPFITPLASKRASHHSSARRGTAPNVPLMRHNFETKPDAFGGRSQSFKGSTSSGSVKKRIAWYRDSLSRRASGDSVPYLDASYFVANRAILGPKSKIGRHCTGSDCNCSGDIWSDNGSESHRKSCRIVFGHNFESNLAHSSAAGSGQNLNLPCSSTPQDPLDRKMGGLLVHHGGSGKRCISQDGDVDRIIKRQVSMTLSIPSREDSLRSCSSSKSYGSYSGTPGPAASAFPVYPCTSSSIANTNTVSGANNSLAAAGSQASGEIEKLSVGRLVRCGSNPDISPSRRAEWRQRKQDTLTVAPLYSLGKKSCSNRSLAVGSNCNIEGMFRGSTGKLSSANSFTNLEDKKKQILSQKQKRNEKVAWVVHLCFTSLLILAITCIVVFLRLSSTMMANSTHLSTTSYNLNSSFPVSTSPEEFSPHVNGSDSFKYDDGGHKNITIKPDATVRKENENLLQSIQPQLNLNNTSTPQPPTQQVDDNTNGNDDSGQKNGDKSTSSLQSGQSLTRTKEGLVVTSLTSSSDSTQSEDGDGEPGSNNKTSHENVNTMSFAEGEGVEERDGPIDRSNNDSSKVAVSSSHNNYISIKTNSIRSKRSKTRPKPDENNGGGSDVPSTRNSNIIISVLNEKVHKNVINDTRPSLVKARHLESTIIRFLKNSSSGSGMRERRNLDMDSRKL